MWILQHFLMASPPLRPSCIEDSNGSRRMIRNKPNILEAFGIAFCKPLFLPWGKHLLLKALTQFNKRICTRKVPLTSSKSFLVLASNFA